MRHVRLYKVIVLTLALAFSIQSTGLGQAAPFLFQAPIITPASLRYVSVNSANPSNYFNFLLDRGDSINNADALTAEAKTLINYFFLAITLPSESFWVNLQPDQPDQIISDELGKTELGKVLVEQDLELKKLAAVYMHPNHPKGKEFWEKLYARVGSSSLNQEISTSNRFWIVPAQVLVVETFDGALVAESRLSVMSENEFLQVKPQDEVQQIAEELLKEIIVPALGDEVNSSATFAPLRQIFHSLILAEWFKQKCASDDSAYAKLINSRDTNGLECEVPWEKQPLWQEYKDSYQKGEYDVKADVAGLTRRYTSGGISLNLVMTDTSAFATRASAGSAVGTLPRQVQAETIVQVFPLEEMRPRDLQIDGDVLVFTAGSQGSSASAPQITTIMPRETTTYPNRLSSLHARIFDFLDQSKRFVDTAAENPLVVHVIGSGRDGAPTVFDLARDAHERGMKNIIIYGIDRNAEFISQAQATLEKVSLPDGVIIEFREGSFDLADLPKAHVVIEANVLRHVVNPDAVADAVMAMRGRLRPDGVLVTATGSARFGIEYIFSDAQGGPLDAGVLPRTAPFASRGQLPVTAAIPSGLLGRKSSGNTAASAIDLAELRQDLRAGGVSRDMALNTVRYHGMTEALPVLKETLQDFISPQNRAAADSRNIQELSEVIAALGGVDEISLVAESMLVLEPAQSAELIPVLNSLAQRIPRETIRFKEPARRALTNLVFHTAATADIRREDRITINELYMNALGVPADMPGNRDLRAALGIQPRVVQVSVFGQPTQIPVSDGAADEYGGVSSSLTSVNPQTRELANPQTYSVSGGIDFSQIEVQVKDQTYVSNLNPAERKILFAAQALKDQWQSLALLYVHELMLMWEENISPEAANRQLLQQVLAELEAGEYLDPDAQQFMLSLPPPVVVP